MDVKKVSSVVPYSDEVLADAREFAESMRRFQAATPEQREQRAADARQRRAEERSSTERQPLTVDAVLDKMGWSREYAEHFVQPYCECYDGMDGWEYCSHARDEGLAGG